MPPGDSFTSVIGISSVVAQNGLRALLGTGVGAGGLTAGEVGPHELGEQSVTAPSSEWVCGPKGKHDPDRTAVRHGTEFGSVTLGGRRVPVERPRTRAADGSGELPVPAYELFSSSEVLARMAMERMLAGLSSRRYPLGLGRSASG